MEWGRHDGLCYAGDSTLPRHSTVEIVGVASRGRNGAKNSV